jgi:hypothetical protein
MSNEKIKRCGWCGHPLDDKCNPLSVEECNKLTDEQLDNADQDNGNCCGGGEHNQKNYITVTRDMASDAGDPDLEGREIEW